MSMQWGVVPKVALSGLSKLNAVNTPHHHYNASISKNVSYVTNGPSAAGARPAQPSGYGNTLLNHSTLLTFAQVVKGSNLTGMPSGHNTSFFANGTQKSSKEMQDTGSQIGNLSAPSLNLPMWINETYNATERSKCSGTATNHGQITSWFTSTVTLSFAVTVFHNATLPGAETLVPITPCKTTTKLKRPQHGIQHAKPLPVPTTISTLLVTKKVPVAVPQAQQVVQGALFGAKAKAAEAQAPATTTPGSGQQTPQQAAPQQAAPQQASPPQAAPQQAATQQASPPQAPPPQAAPQQAAPQEASPPQAPPPQAAAPQAPPQQASPPQAPPPQASPPQASPMGNPAPANESPPSGSSNSQFNGGSSNSGPPSAGSPQSGQLSSGKSGGIQYSTGNQDVNAYGGQSGSEQAAGGQPGGGQQSGGQSSGGQSGQVAGGQSSPVQATGDQSAGQAGGQSAGQSGGTQFGDTVAENQSGNQGAGGHFGIPAGEGQFSPVKAGGGPDQSTGGQSRLESTNGNSVQSGVNIVPESLGNAGGVPVVLHPNNVVIGSSTFNRGTTPASGVYNGQTYSWASSQFVAPSTTIPFPAAVPDAPIVTAGGQTFVVGPSHLEAQGKYIRIPNNAKPSPFILEGQPFAVDQSQIIVSDHSIPLLVSSSQTPFVYDGQTLTIDSSKIIVPSTTIPLTSSSGFVKYKGHILTVGPSGVIGPDTTVVLPQSKQGYITPAPEIITTDGHTLALGPSSAVIGSNTYSFLPGNAATTITDHGQPITMGSEGVHFGSVDIPVPASQPSYSIISQDKLTLSVAPSAVVIGGHTDSIKPGMAPITTVINGQTATIGTEGVALGGTTIPLPKPQPGYSIATAGLLTFSLAHSQAVILGSTYSVGLGAAPITKVIDGQSISIGPEGIDVKGTTVELPTLTDLPAPAMVTAGGMTFTVGPDNAVVGGSTYEIGPGASSTNIIIGNETIGFGNNGIVLPSTTIMPEPTRKAITTDGQQILVGMTDAVLSGTTYPIASGAISQTAIIGTETVTFCTAGVVFPSTTIMPEQTPTPVSADGVTLGADATEAVINGSTYAVGSGASEATIVSGFETIKVGSNGIELASTTIRPWTNLGISGASTSSGSQGTAGAIPGALSPRPTAGPTNSGSEKVSRAAFAMLPFILLWGLCQGVMLGGIIAL